MSFSFIMSFIVFLLVVHCVLGVFSVFSVPVWDGDDRCGVLYAARCVRVCWCVMTLYQSSEDFSLWCLAVLCAFPWSEYIPSDEYYCELGDGHLHIHTSLIQ